MSDKVCYAIYHPFKLKFNIFIICEVIPLFGFKNKVYFVYWNWVHFLWPVCLLAALPLNAGEHGIMCTNENIEVE